MKFAFLSVVFAIGCKSAGGTQSSEAKFFGKRDAKHCFRGDKTNAQKHTCVWDAIVKTKHDDYDMSATGLLDLPNVTLAHRNTRTFVEAGEEMTRRKSIHRYGVIAKVRYEAESGHPYTGLFKSGSPWGFVRLSVTIKPSKDRSELYEESAGRRRSLRRAIDLASKHGPFSNDFSPGMALKIYVPYHDRHVGNQHSVNMHVMYSIDGQKDHNFFSNPLTNIVPHPRLVKTVGGRTIFERGLKRINARYMDPGHLTVDHFAKFEAKGARVPTPKAPHKIVFLPGPGLKESYGTIYDRLRPSARDRTPDLRRILQSPMFGTGKVLYEVYGRDDIGDVDREKETNHNPAAEGFRRIGRLVLASEFVLSRYSDKRMHFAHYTQRR